MSSRFYDMPDSPGDFPAGFSACPPDSMTYLIVLVIFLQDFSACPPDSTICLIVLVIFLQDLLPVLQILQSIS